MMSNHFSQRLLQRFGIYSDEMTEKKILMSVAKKKARLMRSDASGHLFLTEALGPTMIVVFSITGDLITCDLPNKGRR